MITERHPKNSYYETRCRCGKTFCVNYWGDSVFAPLYRSAPKHMGFWHAIFCHLLDFKWKYLFQYAALLAHDALSLVCVVFRMILWPFHKLYEFTYLF